MARKKHAEEHVNLERYLISYADFITLLFATFVVLYALSQIDLARFKDLKISLAKAFSASPTIMEGDAGVMDKQGSSAMDNGGQAENQNIVPPILDSPYAQKENNDFQDALKSINKVEGETAGGKDKGAGKSGKDTGVKAEVTERGLVIKMLGNIMFEPATAQIKKESYKALNEVGILIKTKFINHLIRVEGHTDSQPITSSAYPSNWELSSARASAIVRYLITKHKIPADRFSALGYADSRPVALNFSEAGRKANRRVEIVILRNNSLKTENLSQEFKDDLKNEIDKFKKVTEQQKKKKEGQVASDAVKNLIKEAGEEGESVIIFDATNSTYKKDTKKLLEEIKEKERLNAEESKIRKQQFAESVKNKFNHHNN
jgi:chemotaxis protein MotB